LRERGKGKWRNKHMERVSKRQRNSERYLKREIDLGKERKEKERWRERDGESMRYLENLGNILSH